MTPTPTDHEKRELKACLLCNGGTTQSEGNYMPGVDMGGKPRALISWEIKHWCEKAKGVVSQSINIRGREEADAVAAWNHRVTPTHPALLEECVEALGRADAVLHDIQVAMGNLPVVDIGVLLGIDGIIRNGRDSIESLLTKIRAGKV